MPIALAGGVKATLLSILHFEFLPFFSTEEACKLRLVCREFVGATADIPWMDSKTRIPGDLGKWRACFPRARAANVSWRKDLTDADFVHLAGLHTLGMSECDLQNLESPAAAFAHLRGIHALDMSDCKLIATDALFAHLRGINTLNMGECYLPEITDDAFAYLHGIHTLDMHKCNLPGTTAAAFAHLRGIHTLSMEACTQDTITDSAFAHLRGIHTLNMSYCWQDTITDAAFANLSGIHTLNMSGSYSPPSLQQPCPSARHQHPSHS